MGKHARPARDLGSTRREYPRRLANGVEDVAGRFAELQRDGIAAAIKLAQATAVAERLPGVGRLRGEPPMPPAHGTAGSMFREEVTHEPVHLGWHRDRFGGFSGGNGDFRRGGSGSVAEREITAGALSDGYEIPVVKFDRKQARGLLLAALFLSAWIAWHLGWQSLVLALCAAPSIFFRAVSWILSWFDKPTVVTSSAGRIQLARLHVTVAIPVYNEDPGLLDRCLYAIANQSRPPQLVWVVDDGSTTDYTVLRRYWAGRWPGGPEIRWMRQPNQGKRRAHAVVFDAVPETDILVTVDSDTTLDHHAIEEGLKPFCNRSVMSVAGIEMGFNATVNFLTRLQCSLQLFAQAVIGAAWSVAGDMYTNRGPFALYRASAVRKYMPVYRDEFFLGRRITLGDDSLLALCASAEGRSVQQLSAFGLTMWPERFSHHMRQRIRWARGRTVRNFWRVKYRPVFSYCWWFTVAGIYGFILSLFVIFMTIASWPAAAPDVFRALVILVILSVPNSLRTLCFQRSDETWVDRALLVLVRPLAALWSLLVLARLVRLWGTLTFLRQGWTTRQHGAELVLDTPAEPTHVAGRVPVGAGELV